MLLLQNPQAQTLASRLTAGFLNRALGTNFSIGEIHIGILGTFYLDDLTAYDSRENKMIRIDELELAVGRINRLEKQLTFRQLRLEGVDFMIRKYEKNQPGNFLQMINRFTSESKDTSVRQTSSLWDITIEDFTIRNAHFLYEDKHQKQPTRSINFQDIELLDMDLLASRLKISGDTIEAHFHNLAFVEKSGFELKEFSGDVQFSPKGLSVDQLLIITNNSRLDLDLKFEYNDLSSFSDFITEVRFEGDFRPTTLEMSDIGYFAETMFAMEDLIELEGLFTGTVDNLRGKNFRVEYGNHTRFYGTVSMNGLPDITETFIHAHIKDLKTDAGDVKSFRLPGDVGSIEVPDLLNKMGVVEVKGKFTGFYNDFLANANFNSELGKLKTDIVLKTDKLDNSLSYNGELIAMGLDAGTLLSADPQLGKTSFVLEVDGKGVKLSNLNLTADGIIRSLNFNGYNYRNITVDGTFNDFIFEGHTSIRDENLDFEFNGLIDFEEDKPRFDFYSRVNHANLAKLQLSQRDSVSIISTSMNFDFVATSLDDIKGYVKFDSTTYREGNETYFMENLTLESMHYDDSLNRLNLFSDFADVNVEGIYAISSIVRSVKGFLSNYSQNLANKIKAEPETGMEQSVDFEVQLKETSTLTHLFVPSLEIAPGTALYGNINLRENTADIHANARWIRYASLRFKDWKLLAQSNPENFNTHIGFEKVLVRETSQNDSIGVGVDSLRVHSDFRNDSLQFGITWNDLSNRQVNTGDVSGYFYVGPDKYFAAGFTNANMLFDSTAWTVKPNNRIVSDTTGLFFSGLDFTSDTSMFSIQGGISPNPDDSLVLNFTQLDISHVDQLIPDSKFDVDGVINGDITLINLLSNPNFLADIRMDDLSFNKERLGILNLRTYWADSLSQLAVDLEILRQGNLGTSKVISANGFYYPADTIQNFELNIALQNLGTHIFNPFIREYAEIDEASLASGTLELTGNYQKPVLSGNVNIARTQVLIKYLNTKYSAGGSVHFTENSINVNELMIYDTRRNSASCSGRINHNYFRDFDFDLRIDHENLNALNTTFRNNDMFYGTAFASGIVVITGPPDNILMEIQATTEDETQITIPISSSMSVSENDFIIFLNDADTVAEERPGYNLNVKGFAMDMELDVTPDAKIDIFLPYGMGDISGYGTGNIGLEVSPAGDFSINGDYRISSGSFTFNFEKLVKREFRIREGSKISWEGDPYDANVNITATYQAEPTLAGLRLQTDSTAIRNKRVDVNCNIHLKNSLFNPDVSFSIDLTNVEDDTREIIFAALDTTDQSEMSQQILSLILIGSFSYTTAGPNIGATGFRLLSNQIGNWLSKISKDFDIGFNYQPGTELTEEELKVALRTQLFNDRLLIDGNFGVRGTTPSQNTSNVVGDINLEYQITEDGRFRIKAFNRTNDISFLEDNAPYTQGVGIFYRKEFESFRDLFKRDNDKEKKKDRNTERNQQAVRTENKIND